MPRQTKSSKTQKESEVVVEQQVVVETPVVETQPEKNASLKNPSQRFNQKNLFLFLLL
jgi:hypothetical protein